MSTFFELAEKRQSCRSYADRAVSKEQILKCIETARLSPSACNSQPWSFIAVNGKKKANLVAKCTQDLGMNKFTDGCPSFIIICQEEVNLASKLGGRLKGLDFSEIDLGLVTAHLCYAAAEQGLSTCILGWLNEEKLREVVEIPKKSKVRLVLALGYAENENVREKKRKDLDEIFKYVE